MKTPAKLCHFGISLCTLRFFHCTLTQQNLWKHTMELNIYLKWNCRIRRQLSTIGSGRSCWDGTHTLVRCFRSTWFPLLLMPLPRYVCKWTFRSFWKFNSYTFITTKWEQIQFKKFYQTSLYKISIVSYLWIFFLKQVLSGHLSICYCGCCCRISIPIQQQMKLCSHCCCSFVVCRWWVFIARRFCRNDNDSSHQRRQLLDDNETTTIQKISW